MNEPTTKREVRTALGLTTDAALADLFEISRAAVAQWPEDQPIPQLRLLTLRVKRPEIFRMQVAQ